MSEKAYNEYRTSRAVVIERPYQANLREIELTEPREDALIFTLSF